MRSVKGSEKGAYDGRMRRQRRLRSDVGPATPMVRHPADDTRLTQHLILPPRSASSRQRSTQNPLAGGGFPDCGAYKHDLYLDAAAMEGRREAPMRKG
ncbi:hypothetical protein PR202_gb09340 [Eleusine coracana subsp. coracana]|uniref:Uncharacterized protein n=1 Tax=Eleusine coracana subsp. coracana TaxID=191504 RepID=A0AAV5EEK8_ELECO|nr:hypothetical protein PR202_gb09340 [Eleusine coracana subsp. coracana]